MLCKKYFRNLTIQRKIIKDLSTYQQDLIVLINLYIRINTHTYESRMPNRKNKKSTCRCG